MIRNSCPYRGACVRHTTLLYFFNTVYYPLLSPTSILSHSFNVTISLSLSNSLLCWAQSLRPPLLYFGAWLFYYASASTTRIVVSYRDRYLLRLLCLVCVRITCIYIIIIFPLFLHVSLLDIFSTPFYLLYLYIVRNMMHRRIEYGPLELTLDRLRSILYYIYIVY